MKFGVCIAGKEPVPKMVSLAKLAEELGYDSLWIVDSQLLCRELYITLTACALNTSRLRIGSGVTAPYTRHVSVAASAFATLNEIAQGRLFLGISTGMSIVDTIGAKPARIQELGEYVEKLQALLQNRPVAFEGGITGRITWLEDACPIPVYVAASGPKLIQAAARMSDHVLLHVGVAPSNLKEGLRMVYQGSRDAGRLPEQLRVACYVQASIGRDRSLARERIQAAVATRLRRRSLDSFDPEDRDIIQRIWREYSFVYHSPTGPKPETRIPDKFIDMYALAGTPQEARERVKEMLRVPGFQEVIVVLPVPQKGFPPVESVMRDFAEGVMGHVA